MERESQEDYTKKLYEATIRGTTATLYMLLQRDPLMPDRISISSFRETPLHISSLLGHVDFTAALLYQKPNLSAELNSQGQSPLHLASAEGHTEIVKALLSINTDVCLVPDQYGRIPLHLAAMRVRVEITHQLISACPESAQAKLQGEETVLHLCVKYNHLEALKLLVTSLGDDDDEYLNSQDNHGSTILHLAVTMKQMEVCAFTFKFSINYPKIDFPFLGSML
ncbi:hypothetical protein JCGZ_24722 [Jatropha curcas]|uniref:Uncharacterized protein n=2 Tax=Jatropha curcas TaxID=180498 RepID=A0A067L0L0_JATCU|nr:hypothetical protein JCGZ_24722 [Jatropha curcas]